MAKTLTLDTTSFKFADNETALSFRAYQNGIIVSDNTLSATIKIKQVDVGYLKSVSAKWDNNHIVISSGDLTDLPIGNYLIELWLSNSSGYEIYPDSGFIRLNINQNATAISGNLISSITLADFQQQFSDLSEKVLNKSSDGAVGTKGPKGDTGATGAQGPQGIQGPKGDKGDTGATGAKGDTGAQGPKGDKGDKGDTGEQGPQGLAGNKGEQGPQGIQGERGEQGEQGQQGIQGIAGKGFSIAETFPNVASMKGEGLTKGDFVIISSTVEDPDNAKLYLWNGTDFTFITDMSGATGVKGDTGEQGVKGEQGPKGDTGPQGIQGLQGPQGETGAQGIKGDTGEQGPKGDKGDKGDTGATGEQGPQGPKGDQGIQGDKGDKGDKGDTSYTAESAKYLVVNSIPDSTSLNDLKLSGNYSFATGTVTNSPVPNWFTLVVAQNGSYNGSQTITNTNTGEVYTRTWNSGGTFTDWNKLATDTKVIKSDKEFDGAVTFKGDILPVDLGNYHVDGITYAGTYKSYGNLQGLPISPAYGVLEVVHNDTDILQKFTQTNVSRPFTWERIKNNSIGAWSSWISVTTATTMSPEEISNDTSLVDLITDKAIYSPSERVIFNGWANSNSGKIKVDMYRRETYLNTQYVPFMQNNVTWQCYLPDTDGEQYIFKITVITGSGEGTPQYYAVNVDSNGNHIPLMGFLSKYGEYNPNNQRKVINKLKRRHINYIQYYDCYERPEHLIRTNLSGDDSQAGTAVDYWKDLSRHQVRADTLREYIKLGKESGMKNMLYIPWGNTSAIAGTDGITAEMLLYNDKSKVGDNSAVTATLAGGDGQWARYSLMQANPSNDAFKNMLFNSAKLALEAMGFDGLHIDTLGPNYGNTYTLEGSDYGNDFAASSGMPNFVNGIANCFNTDSWQKTGSNIRFSFNNVGNWGAQYLAGNTNLDFLYAEQWPDMGDKTYDNMYNSIKTLNTYGSQRVVIPAYMHKGGTGTKFNDNGVELTNLVIMASGASHLELGEHMLRGEYFPSDDLSMSSDLESWLTKQYDFKVAFSRFFNNKTYTNNLSFSPSHQVSNGEVRNDKTTLIEISDAYTVATSILATTGLNAMDWQDNNFDRNSLGTLDNFSIGFNKKPKDGNIYVATIDNPIPTVYKADDNNCAVISHIDKYALAYIYV